MNALNFTVRVARLLGLAGALVGSTLPIAAHVGAPPVSSRHPVLPIEFVQQVALLPVNGPAEAAADTQLGHAAPLRFAVPQPVALTPTNSGTWEQLPEGRLWRLRLRSKGATDLNFGFTQFWLPEGATLYVMTESTGYYQGPYTAADNAEAGELWTPAIPGEAGIIELYIPANAKADPRLMLTQVGAGYRDLFARQNDLITPLAASCEIDVTCPQAAPWTNEVRSVARIQIAGTSLCSGTLIMDSARDFRAYFLTANHCGITPGNAASVVVYWNYQSPTCGQHGAGGSLLQNQSGAAFRAAKADADFCLIELNQLPPADYRVYYAGWDRSGLAPAGGVGIHHPNGDGKCISISTNSLTTVNGCAGIAGVKTHWQAVWTSGITEAGSSGSGIWDPVTHKLVGTLSGGGSSCSTPAAPDCYGKFSVAWDSGADATNRLRDWLDPQNTGVAAVAGSDPLRILLGIAVTNHLPQLTIESSLGNSNQIQYRTNFAQSPWFVLTNLLVMQSPYQIVDAGAASAPQRFYRAADTSAYLLVTLRQLWGSSTRINLTTTPIEVTSTPTPVNTTPVSFDSAHTTIWIPMSYLPGWTVDSEVYWGSSVYKMRVVALGAGQMQFHTLSGYFGWGAGNVISTTAAYTTYPVMAAAAPWKSPGTGNTVIVTASAVAANVGDIVWVGGVGADQFQIVGISR